LQAQGLRGVSHSQSSDSDKPQIVWVDIIAPLPYIALHTEPKHYIVCFLQKTALP